MRTSQTPSVLLYTPSPITHSISQRLGTRMRKQQQQGNVSLELMILQNKPRSEGKPSRFTAITAWLLILVLCSSCSSSPPSAPQNIPDYPNAQDVVRQTIPGGINTEQQLQFRTSDGRDEVFQFYHDLLVAEGWHARDDLATAEQRIFGWSTSGESYTFAIFIRSVTQTTTVVEVQLVRSLVG